MNVLLATSELEPLTGRTPLGRTARRVARELEACPDAAVSVVLPASESLLRSQAGNLIEEGRLAPEPATILRWHGTGGPDIFLLDAPPLRRAFDPNSSEDVHAGDALEWARHLAALLPRIRPAIHLVHAFGWESALLPVLSEAHRVPVATCLSAPPAHPVGPSLRSVIAADRRSRCGNLLPSPDEKALDHPLYTWAASRAGATDALPHFAAEPGGDRDFVTAAAETAAVRKAQGLEKDAHATVVFVPGHLPGNLLPILPRLLEAGAQIVLESAPAGSSDAAALTALAASRPGRLACLDAHPGASLDPADALAAADFVLLHPEAGADPAIARHALATGCIPVLSSGHPSLAASTREPNRLRESALLFRDAAPEAVWSRLKDAIALRGDSRRWNAHRENMRRPGENSGENSAELSPELTALYFRSIARKLAFD